MWQKLLVFLPSLFRVLRALALPLAGVVVGATVQTPLSGPAPMREIRWSEHPAMVALESRLRLQLPPPKPVLVATTELRSQGLQGLSLDKGTYFLVLLDAGLDPSLQAETLLHEWAHLLSWGDGHGPLWAQSYGMAFRMWAGN